MPSLASTNPDATQVAQTVCRTTKDLDVAAASQGVTVEYLTAEQFKTLWSKQLGAGGDVPEVIRAEGNTAGVVQIKDSPITFVMVFNKEGCFITKGTLATSKYEEFMGRGA